MSTQILKYVVGADVSKKELEICFKTLYAGQETKIKGARKFPNTENGFQALHKWIEKRRKDQLVPVIVVLEATGVYHENCAHFFQEKGYSVSIVLPTQSTYFLKSQGNKSKTDKIDASGLAQMGAERQLRIWIPPSKHLVEIRNLNRHKDALEKTKTQTNNRLHAHSSSHQVNTLIVNQLEAQIDYLDEQIAAIGDAINEALEEQSEFGQKVEKIAKFINGVGKATVACIAAETFGFNLFYSMGQLTSFVGYDIIENQSGNHRGKTRISKKGNSHIRKALYFPALNVVRLEVKTFSDLYERVFDRTKIKMKGYVAVQRKLLCLIYTLWKKDEAFDPDYQIKLEQEQVLQLLPLPSATLDRLEL